MNNYSEQVNSITTKYPSLRIEEIKTIEHGQNNIILLINNELIFRFPRANVNKAILDIEYSVLSKISDLLPLKTPKIKYYSLGANLTDTFMGYKLINGETLSKEIFVGKDKSEIGKQLSNFLAILHSDEILSKFEPILKREKPYEYWKDMFQRIEEKLYPFMRDDIKDTVTEDFSKILNTLNGTDFKTTVVHGDFGPSNILVDKNSSQINGIIDFGEIHIGDPAEDIASLIGAFGYGVDFIKNEFTGYPEAVNMLERAILYTKSFALQEALYGVENDDKRAFDAGMRNYI